MYTPNIFKNSTVEENILRDDIIGLFMKQVKTQDDIIIIFSPAVATVMNNVKLYCSIRRLGSTKTITRSIDSYWNEINTVDIVGLPIINTDSVAYLS